MQFTLWLEFEHWLPRADDDPTNDFFNMILEFADGRTIGFTVCTIRYYRDHIQEILHQLQESVDQHGYAMTFDLIVEKMERAYLEELVMRLVSENKLPTISM